MVEQSIWAKKQKRRARQRKAVRTAGLPEAPGDLELVQAFLNTAARDRHPDLLGSPEDLGSWLERRGLLAAGTKLDAEQWKRALDLRENLRTMIRAAADPVEPRLLRSLEGAAVDGRLKVRFDDGGPSGVGPASGRFDDALTCLVAMVAIARQQDLWPRFAVCVRSACRRAFFKSSKSRGAKWCTPQCGERVRTARRRALRSS